MVDSRAVVLGLDVGSKRIGVAVGDTIGRLAAPVVTLEVDGNEDAYLQHLIAQYGATRLVVGLPRNQSGVETKQSAFVRNFVNQKLQGFGLPITWQDESVTSVIAEENLKRRSKAFTKGDIDAEAACIILQDYLEMCHG